MSILPAPWEVGNNAWTSLSREYTFYQNLEGTGGFHHEEVGRTIEDRPIHKCSIGTPNTSCVFIISAQHGPEKATRESSFIMLRDLAYRTESWMDDYLSNHEVIYFPTASPDGVNAGERNTHDVNMNRCWRNLALVENEVIQKAINDVDPDIVMDAHEVSGDVAIWRPFPAGYPGEDPVLNQLATEFVDSTGAYLETLGYDWELYNVNINPWASLSVVSSGDNRVGILSETSRFQDVTNRRNDRVVVTRITYERLFLWHRDHKADIKAARVNAKIKAATEDQSDIIPTREYTDTNRKPLTPVTAIGYKLTSAIPQKYIDAFGIDVEPNGIVWIKQESRRAVVGLFDPQAFDRIMDVEAIMPSDTIVQHDGYGTYVFVDGVRYGVSAIYVQVDGYRYKANDVYTQTDGIRYRMSK